MSYLDFEASHKALKDQVLAGIRANFPEDGIRGREYTLRLKSLEVADSNKPHDAITEQARLKAQEGTYAAPIYGTLEVVHNGTGRSVERKVKLADLPVITNRHSYLVDGQEWNVTGQWQLRPGVYTRRRQNGELETRFNVTGGRAFDIKFDPESKLFIMERGTSKHINAYPILSAMGVKDEELQKVWGDEIFKANKEHASNSSALDKFYKVDNSKYPETQEEALAYLHKAMQDSKLQPEAVKATTGHAYTHVEPGTLMYATKRMLDVQNGAPEDNRDSILFKQLRDVSDYAYDRLTDWKTRRMVQAKIRRQLDRNFGTSMPTPGDIMRTDVFNPHVRGAITQSRNLSEVSRQVNPLDMVSAAMRTSIMGPGGIQSEQQVMDAAKMVDPSHFAFVDPLETPEGAKVGITLNLPIGVHKHGKVPTVPIYNLQTGKSERITPDKFVASKVVFPDQVVWRDGKPHAIAEKVRLMGAGNEIQEMPLHQAQYTLLHPSQVFSLANNMMPFLNNNSGNRVNYASHHMTQSISLVNRDAPLVQTATGSKVPGAETFESILGRHTSHIAPVAGVVQSVTRNGIVIKGDDGKKREVQLYNHFPLNDSKSTLHSTPLVKPGDRVAKDQHLADTNFTRNGVFALGKNLTVGYVPMRGYNFEDSIVISESASKKLTSEHLSKPSVKLQEHDILDPRKFVLQQTGVFNMKQLENIGSDGLVRVGSKVRPGDPLVLVLKPPTLNDRSGAAKVRKSLANIHSDGSLRWSSDFEGTVVAVNKTRNGRVSVHVRTEEPARVGDKLSSRAGAKGVIGLVLPDHEMPRTKDGPLDLAISPYATPGRMNLGHLLEVAAGKIAQKTGKPYLVENFKGGDVLSRIQSELKAHGLSDTEEVVDPKTGITLGRTLVGPQHILKLMHQSEKKVSARSGMTLRGDEPESYDINLVPTSGGHAGGQSFGNLGMNALLAHNAKAIIREAQTLKSEGIEANVPEHKEWKSLHREVWNNIQMGLPIPTPKPTFAFAKFTSMLQAAGINVEKNGSKFQLSPLTNAEILKMSKGELKRPAELTYAKLDKDGNLKTIHGGLFDEHITGGIGGKNWGHIALAEPMPNPVFDKAIQKVLGISSKAYQHLVEGSWSVDTHGKVLENSNGVHSGGPAVYHLLSKIDVPSELKKTQEELAKQKLDSSLPFRDNTQKLDTLVKKLKYLSLLKAKGVKPSDAYVLHNLPVLPPAMRPPGLMDDGSVRWDDMNVLYKNFAENNQVLKESLGTGAYSHDMLKRQRAAQYNAVSAVMGRASLDKTNFEDTQGLLKQISGTSPKEGFFQNTLLSRRQDMSMRGVVVPEPHMGVDEVGLPTGKALKLFQPFVIRKLVQLGHAPTALDTWKLLEQKDAHKDSRVLSALDQVMRERPILMKRDPALHKHSLQAFMSHRVAGNSIAVHPLIASGYNLDHDGDTTSAYVPLTSEAVEEAKRMLPSRNIFNMGSGAVELKTGQDASMGLFKLTLVGDNSGKKFAHPAEILKAVQSGDIKADSVVELTGVGKTTANRVMLTTALPSKYHSQALTDLNWKLDKKGNSALFTDMAKDQATFSKHAEDAMRLGYDAAHGVIHLRKPGLTDHALFKALDGKTSDVQYIPVGISGISLSQFATDKATRDPILRETQAKVDALRAKNLTKAEHDAAAVKLWQAADDRIQAEHVRTADNRNTVFQMIQSGGKPSMTQYKQMLLAPMLFADLSGRAIPIPVKQNYGEGFDMAGYWLAASGARKGSVQKTQEVRDPGYFSKQLVNTTMSIVVNGHDCGTAHGVALPIGDKGLIDRELATDVTVKGHTFKRGTRLSQDVLGAIGALDSGAKVVVRSPMKCMHGEGICQKCAGLAPDGQHYELGTNLGVIASQALGERSTQLVLKSFHSGGAASAGGGLVGAFDRVQQLTMLPRLLPDSSKLAMTSGKVEKIEHDATGANIWVNGVRHHVPKDRLGRHLHTAVDGSPSTWHPPVVGQHVEAGALLSDPSRTVVNPHDLYKATGDMPRVHAYIADELHKIYGEQGIRRQHIETLVRGMGNLTRIRDTGDAHLHDHHFIKGDFASANQVRAINAELQKKGLRPIEHSPILKGIDVIPLADNDNWMGKLNYQRLRETLTHGAATGSSSDIHGLHPIPGMAFGAEFGYTSEHALRMPGKGLENVPRWGH